MKHKHVKRETDLLATGFGYNPKTITKPKPGSRAEEALEIIRPLAGNSSNIEMANALLDANVCHRGAVGGWLKASLLRINEGM